MLSDFFLFFFKKKKGIWSQRMNQKSNRTPPKALLGFLGFRRIQKKKRENNEDVYNRLQAWIRRRDSVFRFY